MSLNRVDSDFICGNIAISVSWYPDTMCFYSSICRGVSTTKDRFLLCYSISQKLVVNVKKIDEVRLKTFYAFSYYYERAFEAGLIGE